MLGLYLQISAYWQRRNRGRQVTMLPNIFNLYSHFVHEEAVSQTK